MAFMWNKCLLHLIFTRNSLRLNCIVDTIERAYEEKLLEEKWSRNKTLQRKKRK